MRPLGTNSRRNRKAILFLLFTLVVAGLEIWGIRAAIANLF